MAQVLTSNPRTRLRPGRKVYYQPTSAQVTANGVGPWPGIIVAVNSDGTCTLDVVPTTRTTGTADATWGASPEAAMLNGLAASIKTSVVQGGLAGQFTLAAMH